MVFFLRRLRCHFCGARSSHNKSSGIQEFQCTSCEAVNFLDEQGNITDTPANFVLRHELQPPTSPSVFPRSLLSPLEHQQQPPFCGTCQRNQRIYFEALANYLPEEDHPQYREFEAGLSQHKQELEERYPLICKKCAPNAQGRIHDADQFAGTQHISTLCRDPRGRRAGSPTGRRDDWVKFGMRVMLGLLGAIVYGSLMVQIAWHGYGIFRGLVGKKENFDADIDVAFGPTLRGCASQVLFLRFNSSCYELFAGMMPKALLASLLLLWYNPGLAAWFHPNTRVEAVEGWQQHFVLQAILIVARTVAWMQLRNPSDKLSMQQVLAAHGFAIALMLGVQNLSHRAVTVVPWKLHLRVTPKPSDMNVLGISAGPGDDEYDRQASSLPPTKLLARDRLAPFPIGNLALTRDSTSSMDASTGAPPPSPPESMSDFSGIDAMEIDYPTPPHSRMPGTKPDRAYRPRFGGEQRHPADPRSTWNPFSTQSTGWAAMRDETFRMQADVDVGAERKHQEAEARAKLQYNPPVELSPFRGRLPQAPMSAARRLRNPPTQVLFRKTEPSKQQDFMLQMQPKTYGCNNVFGQPRAEDRIQALRDYDSGEEDSPAKLRTRGGLELRASSWRLPGDESKATGLEDLLGGNSFRIADAPALPQLGETDATHAVMSRKDFDRVLRRVVIGLVPVALALAAWQVKESRRAICLWFVARLEDMGY